MAIDVTYSCLLVSRLVCHVGELLSRSLKVTLCRGHIAQCFFGGILRHFQIMTPTICPSSETFLVSDDMQEI